MPNSKGIRWRHVQRQALQVLVDIILINASFVAALYLYYEKVVPPAAIARYANIWPFLTLFCLGALYVTRVYRCLWRYAGIDEVLKLFIATLTGIGLTYLFAIIVTAAQRANTEITFFEYLFALIGNSVRINPNNLLHGKLIYGLAWLLFFMSITAQRFFIRLVSHTGSRRRSLKEQTRRVMVVGAGWGGASVIRDLRARDYREGVPVVVVDDDPAKANTLLSNVLIEYNTALIPEYVKKHKCSDIVIALPDAKNAEMRRVLQIAATTGCKLRMVTAMQDVTDGKQTLSAMRDVNIADLLCREEVKLDMASIEAYLTNKTVLVTGGGGSIGSELCRQIASFGPAHLIVFDIYENNAYELEQELRSKYGANLKLTVLIGSVRDAGRLDEVFGAHKPDVVFHAAAHKHVPLMEDSPSEAVKNNVFGTLNVAQCAARHNVRRMVQISTDKAVNPTNVMGATKRVTEMIIQHMAKTSKTKFMAVRFGNVLGSNGSVIPLFKKQIERGGPVSVTHPDITRFFMTIPEAAQLVLQAGGIGETGSIFVLDMGTPVKIVDLARNLISLAGFTPDEDIKIEFVGLRPGEKLYEELAMTEEQESLHTTCHDKIMVLNQVDTDGAAFLRELDTLKKAAERGEDAVRQTLHVLVPSFKEPLHEAG